MIAHVCSSIRLQLGRRCFALQASRGLTTHLDKRKPSHLQQGQMSGQHIRSISSLHDDAPSGKENNLRDILGFPIVTVTYNWRMRFMKYYYGRAWPHIFDPLELSRGVIANPEVLTNLIKQASPTKVQELQTRKIITDKGYKSVLNAITQSQKNPRAANEMVVKASDVMDVTVQYIAQGRGHGNQRVYEKYPNCVCLIIGTKVTYVKNFEQKLGHQFSFKPKEGDSMNAERLERVQKKVIDLFDKDCRVCYIRLGRAYKNRSLKTPISEYVLTNIEFK